MTFGVLPEDLALCDAGALSVIRAVVEQGLMPRVGDSVGFFVRDVATLHLFDNLAPGQPAIARVIA